MWAYHWGAFARERCAELCVDNEKIQAALALRIAGQAYSTHGAKGRLRTTISLGKGYRYEVEFAITEPNLVYIQRVDPETESP